MLSIGVKKKHFHTFSLCVAAFFKGGQYSSSDLAPFNLSKVYKNVNATDSQMKMKIWQTCVY